MAALLPRGGVFGLELVADLPDWREYQKRVSLRGRRGRARHAHHAPRIGPAGPRSGGSRSSTRSSSKAGAGRPSANGSPSTFRTLSVPQMAARLEKAGFEVTAMLGDYRGGPWDPRADVWILLATRR